MIDTLMILWTKGIFARFLRFLLSFLLLFATVCFLLFLVATSNIKWPGLAFTATAPDVSNASADSSASPVTVSTPGVAALAIPVILHNPVPTATSIPLLPTPIATYPLHSNLTYPEHVRKRHIVPAATRTATPAPAKAPTAEPTANEAQGWFSGAISANGRLAGPLADRAPIPALESMFWPALLASIGMVMCCLSLLSFIRRRGRRTP